MAQIEATTALLEKQGLEVVVAAVSELKPDAEGKLQGWQVCSDTSLSIADFKAALADVCATRLSNPRLAEPQAEPQTSTPGRPATHTCAPRLGQPAAGEAGDFGKMADHLTGGRPHRPRTP